MTKNRDPRTRYEKVRDNIYATIMNDSKVINTKAAKDEANRQADEIFAKVPDMTCPTHGEKYESAHTAYEPRFRCPVIGCTQAYWGNTVGMDK